MAIPTQARARAYFNYDPSTGHLIFKERPRTDFVRPCDYGRHMKLVGQIANATNVEGYIKVRIDGGVYNGHTVAWLMMTGEWVLYPEFEIDHINGIRKDNRFCNLRKVTKSQNQRNAGKRMNNTSGIHGVNWKPKTSGNGGGWVARIWNGPRHVYLGFFQDINHAAIARRAAEKALGYTRTDCEPSDVAKAKRARSRAKENAI